MTQTTLPKYLQLAQEIETRIRGVLKVAQGNLNRIDYRKLNTDARLRYGEDLRELQVPVEKVVLVPQSQDLLVGGVRHLRLVAATQSAEHLVGRRLWCALPLGPDERGTPRVCR